MRCISVIWVVGKVLSLPSKLNFKIQEPYEKLYPQKIWYSYKFVYLTRFRYLELLLHPLVWSIVSENEMNIVLS